MFFTIGHSRHALDAFLGLLKGAGVRFLVDVRTVPRSRTNPQFNRETLPRALAEQGIGYEHAAALGGLRPRSAGTPVEVNALWENQALWWRCHRRIIADYLLAAGEEVSHIMSDGKLVAAKMTPGASVRGREASAPAPLVTYPGRSSPRDT